MVQPRRTGASRNAKWTIALAVIAATALVGIAADKLRAHDPLEHLASVAARLPTRPVESRFARFRYTPRSPSHGAPRRFGSLLRAAGARFLSQPAAADARNLHARAVAMLFVGKISSAVSDMRAVVQREPRNADAWSDLAAVEYSGAATDAGKDAQGLVHALAAADRALLLDPNHAPARFNRALIIDALEILPVAHHAWADYLRVDSTSGWAREARARQKRCAAATRLELWKSSALPGLEKAVQRDDHTAIRRRVAMYRQETRTWSEVQVLADWAAASQAGNDSRANGRLRFARAVGEALLAINGERLLIDAVANIESVPADQLRHVAVAAQRYAEARLLHHRGKTTQALPLFKVASREFRVAHNPMTYVADYYVAIGEHVAGNDRASIALIDGLLRRVPAAYTALRAQLLWQRGTNLGRGGMLVESLDAYRGALALFAKLGEYANANLMRHTIAATEAALGRDGAAWRMRLDVFRNLSAVGDAGSLQSAVESAARTEALAQRWDTARALLTVAVDPRICANRTVHANSLIWRALSAHRLQDEDAAATDIRRASIAVTAIPDRQAQDILNRVTLAEAVLIRQRDPRRAIQLFTSYVTRAAKTQDVFLTPEALLERAKAWKAVGDFSAAERDLNQLLEILKGRQAGSDGGLRDAFFTTGEVATRELIDVLDRQSNEVAAFAAAERARPRMGQRFGVPVSDDAVAKIRASSGGARLVVEYVALDDRLLLFSTDGARLRVDRSLVSRAELGREAALLHAALRSSDESSARRQLRKLHQWLIEPIDDRVSLNAMLVVVTDPAIASVPFGALLDPTSNTFLVERAAIVTAPSVFAYQSLSGVEPRTSVPERAVVVGDPTIDHQRFPGLAALPRARAEASRVARTSRNATLLVGKDATKLNVMEQLESATTAHIASHGVLVDRDPPQSFLVLAPTASDSGALYLHEIAEMQLTPGALIVLTGCSTSAPGRSHDLNSFAHAFLAAGAANVVGSLWDVNDDLTEPFAIRFTQELDAGRRPADALRNVQLQMLRAPSARLRALRSWSAFQITGSGD